ncbi:WYL domain-containing protein [Clostridium sp. AF19-22AC]|jgi:predicted DNA-binding transcriptional regulator YafY|uniref:helix-turn-helix transcriptional regulator n=1 Tax=Clostridia TaxID=186801 RepID=UPI000E5212E8|nr:MULTISPECIES: WYL domain-containing protein [Clostridia]RHR27560.1 WYL domain-containing protein [Clostridium sp. AF19-22AC]
MARSSNQKEKILFLMRLFHEETDAVHPLSRKQLEEKLLEYGIQAERKSLYNDIETLKKFGMDIAYRKERPEGYFLQSHEFELAELKLLVDAVQSSRFITESKSNSLIRKIESMASKYEAKQLQRQVVVANRIKAMNESIYYNIDKIYASIASNQQILFRYFEWTIEKTTRLKKGGEPYQVSPWALTWDDENYYLIGYDVDAGILKHFRVDKMLDIETLGEPRVGKEEFGRFDLAHYTKKTFGMFGGEEETLRIRFHNKYIGVVIDRFGKDVSVRPDGEESFTARVDVAVSGQFFGWLTGLGKDVRILSPVYVADMYLDFLKEITGAYDSGE